MKTKQTLYTELAYVLGIIVLAYGTAFMERADMGLSMVVAPAYLLHLKISQTFSFFTFGVAEYTLQAVLLVVLCIIMRRAKLSYLFSFVTAVYYGTVLDFSIWTVSFLPGDDTLTWRIIYYFIGVFVCSLGVSLIFHTYISPEAYELFVKEISDKKGWNISRVKTIYDCTSCLIGVILSFAFFGFGHFEGVKLGTIFCALINGTLIGIISKFMESHFEFRDRLNLRSLFNR